MKAAQSEKDDKKQEKQSEDEDKKAAENQLRALRFTMYAMGGMFLGTGLYIFFQYGNDDIVTTLEI